MGRSLSFLIMFAFGMTFVNGYLGSILKGPYVPAVVNQRRVSRGPNYAPDGIEGGEALGSTYHLKNPSYLHRLLRPPSPQSSFKDDERVLARRALGPNSFPFPSFSGFGRTGGKALLKPVGPIDNSASSEEELYGFDREHSTFNPFIGPRALSNMEMFFEHLRDNIEAIQEDEGRVGKTFKGQFERRREPGNFGSQDLASEFQYAPIKIEQKHKIRNFAKPVKQSDDEIYLEKANNYSPRWLWPTMGLGRRR